MDQEKNCYLFLREKEATADRKRTVKPACIDVCVWMVQLLCLLDKSCVNYEKKIQMNGVFLSQCGVVCAWKRPDREEDTRQVSINPQGMVRADKQKDEEGGWRI